MKFSHHTAMKIDRTFWLRTTALLLFMLLAVQALPQTNVLHLYHYKRTRTYEIKEGRMVFFHMPSNSNTWSSSGDSTYSVMGRVTEITTSGITIKDIGEKDLYHYIRYEDLNDISIRTGDRAALATVGNVVLLSMYVALVAYGGGCYGDDFFAFGSWKDFNFSDDKWRFRVQQENGGPAIENGQPDYYDPGG